MNLSVVCSLDCSVNFADLAQNSLEFVYLFVCLFVWVFVFLVRELSQLLMEG